MTTAPTIRTTQAAGRQRDGVSGRALSNTSGRLPVEKFPSGNSAAGASIENSIHEALSDTDNRLRNFFSIAELAVRWRVSRSAVYVYLRGYPVIDFAPTPGRKGHKLVSAEVVRQIEREHERVLR